MSTQLDTSANRPRATLGDEAGAWLAAVKRSKAVSLVDLYRGYVDADGYVSHGYPSEALAYALCVRLKPKTLSAARRAIFGEDCPKKTERVDFEVVGFRQWTLLQVAFLAWTEDGRP